MITYFVENRSSNISEICYDPLDEILYVLFRSGMKYEYAGFPSGKLKHFIEADSIGKHFNNSIKDKFPAKKIGEAKSKFFEVGVLIRNVEKHSFTCEAGPLVKCSSWVKLKKILLEK